MLFNSFNYAVFFIAVFIMFYSLPQKYRWGMLLLASCVFYMFFIPVYILILAVTITIDYFAGMLIEDSRGNKRAWLIVSIISTCLVLFIFKYFNFFNGNFASIAAFFQWKYPVAMVNIILPIGLSFHTFQSLSYVIEVYYGRQKAERHFGIYSLYVMFFPQLVAGPIERPKNLLHQFREVHAFDYNMVTDGLKIILWGLFKKIVIADALAQLVAPVYKNPSAFTGPDLIIATVCFAFQIFCDFSGYSDIAVGSAQVLGFKLMANFNRPYFSKSITEFWKRWHISLSSWFRDYLYFSLGGNRISVKRTYLNLFIVFVVSGLWHGANWTFIAWGVLNGVYVILEKLFSGISKKPDEITGPGRFLFLKNLVSTAFTFSLVCFGWIFFRSASIKDAFFIISRLPYGWDIFAAKMSDGTAFFAHNRYLFGTTVFSIIIMEIVHLIQRREPVIHIINRQPVLIRWGAYFSLVIYVLLFGQFAYPTQFIYFQF